MSDRFVVVDSGEVPADDSFQVWFVSEGALYSSENDPYTHPDSNGSIILDLKLEDCIHGDQFPAVQAVAGLDAGNSDQTYRDALCDVFEAGFLAGVKYQRELIAKRDREFNRQEREEAGLS